MPRAGFPAPLGAPGDLAALVDSTMCQQLADAYIAGAAVAIVDGDRIAFSSGYGHADAHEKSPVDPARTPFRIGSVSKLFTWTALMQLSNGPLRLTTDIRSWLPATVSIPSSFPASITPRNLMTHTTGFETNIAGVGLAPAATMAPTLAATIAEHVPARVRPPSITYARGSDAAYSNWVGALGGYIVEQVTGQAIDDYMDQRIFARLGMAHSSFREPLPADLAVLAARGHRPDEGYPDCTEPLVHGLAPASSASASAEDMGRFMRGHMDSRLLGPATTQLMHSRAFSPHQNLAGAAYGFNERYFNGRRLLWHAGATPCFYAELYLFPEERIGLFVAYNTHPLASQRAGLTRAFMDRYFPATLPPLQPSPGDADALAAFAGYYRTTSRSHKTWEKIFDLTGWVQVEVTESGFLRAPASPGSKRRAEWVHVPQVPGVFRRSDTEDTIAFVQEGSEMYLLGPWPFAPMVKLDRLSDPQFNGFFVGLSALGFATTLLFFVRRTAVPDWHRYRSLGALAAWASAVNLAILICLLATARRSTIELMIALPGSLWAALTLSCVSGVLAVALLTVVIRTWPNSPVSPWTRAGFAALALPNLTFALWLWHWNLIGFRLG